MRIIEPYVEVFPLVSGDDALRHIERCGRVCYKSEDKREAGTAEKFVWGLIRSGHESVIEHISITARIVCDRGVSHEIVRHRLASYSQESTRYCNYSQDKFGREITVVRPCFWEEDSKQLLTWEMSCRMAEDAYFTLLDLGATPQEARSVLPNSLKTEVMMTANVREWRWFFNQRLSPAAHPQMRQVARMALTGMQGLYPVLFDDVGD